MLQTTKRLTILAVFALLAAAPTAAQDPTADEPDGALAKIEFRVRAGLGPNLFHQNELDGFCDDNMQRSCSVQTTFVGTDLALEARTALTDVVSLGIALGRTGLDGADIEADHVPTPSFQPTGSSGSPCTTAGAPSRSGRRYSPGTR
jgi:hypothetical protein